MYRIFCLFEYKIYTGKCVQIRLTGFCFILLNFLNKVTVFVLSVFIDTKQIIKVTY